MSIQPETPDILLCPICHEKIEETDNIPLLPCNHKFHNECLANYCNHKNNHDVLCPLCRTNITQSCNTINPITPFVNLYLDIDGAYELPYSNDELLAMSIEDRGAAQKVITRIRRNFLARRRRAMSMETPQQLAQRFEIEEADRNRRQAEQAALYAGGRKTKNSKAKRKRIKTKTKKKRKKLDHRR